MLVLIYNSNMSNPTQLREARIKRRLLFIDILGGCCVNCGGVENLEFDHVFREDMSFRIGTAMLMKLERALPELQKCQLLCHDCHVEKTNTEYDRIKNIGHGHPSTYNNNGCRCRECKDSWAIYIRNRKKVLQP